MKSMGTAGVQAICGAVPVGGGSVQGEADTEGGAGAQKGAGQPSGSLREALERSRRRRSLEEERGSLAILTQNNFVFCT